MFKTITIRGGKWTAEISAELGANVTSLTYEDKNVFVPLLNRDQLAINPYIQGAPLLLPANRTAGGKFSFEGREYTLAITEERTGANLHGLLHREAFVLTEVYDNRVVLQYRNQDKIYPFSFEITVTYTIENDKFLQQYAIKNTGKGNMPLTFALHTSFVEPERFSVPVDACHTKDENHIPYGPYDPLNEQERRYATGSPSKGITISGYYRACGDTAIVGDFFYSAEGCDHWILFNGEGKKELLCVEPQWGQVDGLNTDHGKLVVSAGQTVRLWTEISKNEKQMPG